MLDTRADRERFGLHKHAALREHFKGISCRMAKRKDECCGFFFAAVCVHAFHGCVFYLKPVKAGIEPYLAAEADDTLSYRFNDAAQIIGAYVRLCFCAYLPRCAELNESFKDVAAQGVVYAGGELAVREGTCAALAELHVGILVKCAALPEAVNGLRALFDLLAALEDYRLIALLGKRKCAEHSRGTEACDDNSAVCFFARYGRLKARRCGICDILVLFAELFFKLRIEKSDEHRADVVDIILSACVKGDLMYLRGLNEVCTYAKRSDRLLHDAFVRLRKRGVYPIYY